MQQGVVGDMKALGVREAYKSKLQVSAGRRVLYCFKLFVWCSCVDDINRCGHLPNACF